MKFTNTVEDLIVWGEFRAFRLMTYRLIDNIIKLTGLFIAMFFYIRRSNIFSFKTFDFTIQLINMITLIVLLIISIYILYFLEPKFVRTTIRKKCIKVWQNNNKSFEKEVFLEENAIKIIGKSKEFKIIIKKNTRLIRYKNCILIADIIMKNIPIKLYSLIFPLERLNAEQINFITESKIEILNFNK